MYFTWSIENTLLARAKIGHCSSLTFLRSALRQVVVDVEIAQLKVITVYQPLGTVAEVIAVVQRCQTRYIGDVSRFLRPPDFVVQIPVGYIGVIAQCQYTLLTFIILL